MISGAAYYEILDMIGRFAQLRTLGEYSALEDFFTESPQIEIVEGDERFSFRKASGFSSFLQKRYKGTREFFSVGSPEMNLESGSEIPCLWMFVQILPDGDQGIHVTGRLDLVIKKVEGSCRIDQYKEYARVRLEPQPMQLSDNLFEAPQKEELKLEECQADIAELIEATNQYTKYVQYLHAGEKDRIVDLFLDSEDSSWLADSVRRKYLAAHPEIGKGEDGPGDTDIPPYWMGAYLGKEGVEKGFSDLVAVSSPENKGIYSGSHALSILAVKNKETDRIYTSAISYGGFIAGPVLTPKTPYPVVYGTGRWYFEWQKDASGNWKVKHFFWSTYDAAMIDRYDPVHRKDWISVHDRLTDWPDVF